VSVEFENLDSDCVPLPASVLLLTLTELLKNRVSTGDKVTGNTDEVEANEVQKAFEAVDEEAEEEEESEDTELEVVEFTEEESRVVEDVEEEDNDSVETEEMLEDEWDVTG
jgi:hypothetical protein